MIKAKIKEKYRGLSVQELLDKAYELGFNYEKNSESCSQCTVAALHEILGFDSVVVRVATSSEGGQADQVVGTCGGLIGGTMVLDYYFGRPVESLSCQERIDTNIQTLADAAGVAKLLYDKYVDEYGTILCPHIQVQRFGRHYYFSDPDEAKKFEGAGGHSGPDKCSHIVGTAARWTMEILLDNGAININE
ncbi:MAG: C-GCAxxG-C-C family protein [Dehalococcoidales bacterium]|nr:C-GCAxxG-C-C family protein [Dehalococcoidales bacterium]